MKKLKVEAFCCKMQPGEDNKWYFLFALLGNQCTRFLAISGLLLMMLLAGEGVKAQNDLDVIGTWLRFSDASNSLYHHVAGQAFGFLDQRSANIAGINSLPGFKKRQEKVRKILLDIVGPFPEKTPLNANIVSTVNKNGYKVENIIYESQPGFYVTSSLFIPDGLREGQKAPAVIYCSGHSNDGYRNPVYQHVILNLVKKGFIVFAFDPVGQGERLEYYDTKTGKSSARMSEEHSYSGIQAFITGASQARYVIWDGIRAIDYLLTRKEVDPERIGMTGRSGGGTQTAYIAAMDNRIKAAAPENYITNFTRLIQTIGPQDAEQNMLNAVERGLDMADYLSVRAPKPTLMITTTRDIFSIQGARETAKEVSRIYKAYGRQENFRMVTDDSIHASTKKNREAMYGFFQKSLNNPGDSSDEQLTILTPEELRVTKTGQVSTSLKGETIFSLNRITAEKLENKLQASRKIFPGYLNGILSSAKKLSGYQQPVKTGEPVFTGRFQRNGYVIEKYFIKGEGDYVIPYLLFKPDRSNDKALIYLHPSGKSAEAAPDGELEWFVRKGLTVLAPDLLGTGEMAPGKTASKRSNLLNWYASMLIGRSIVGIQAGDVVRLTDLLKRTNGIKEVYGLAKKEMAPVLLHAAAFDTSLSRIALIESYSSFRSVIMNRFYSPGFIQSLVPAALTAYDLPDLAASIAPRKLMMVGTTDGAGKATGDIHEDVSVIKAGYHSLKADNQLKIIEGGSKNKLPDIYNAWIQ